VVPPRGTLHTRYTLQEVIIPSKTNEIVPCFPTFHRRHRSKTWKKGGRFYCLPFHLKTPFSHLLFFLLSPSLRLFISESHPCQIHRPPRGTKTTTNQPGLNHLALTKAKLSHRTKIHYISDFCVRLSSD
jgi:hypothetical protein